MRGFEGGQMPLHRRLPKRGFNNIFRVEYTVLGLDRVAEILASAPGTEFTLDAIVSLGLLRKKGGLIKVLNNGELTGRLPFTRTSSPSPRRRPSRRPAAKQF